jgi:hypothetical protein
MYRIVLLVFLVCVWLKLWADTAAAAATSRQVVRLDTAQEQYDGFIDGWEAT